MNTTRTICCLIGLIASQLLPVHAWAEDTRLGYIQVTPRDAAGAFPVGPIRMPANHETVFKEYRSRAGADSNASAENLSKLLATHHLVLYSAAQPEIEFPVQWEFDAGGDQFDGNLLWFVHTPQFPGGEYVLVLRDGEPGKPLAVEDVDGRSLVVSSAGKPLLQYNYGVVQRQPGQQGEYDRACYLHPIWSPSGSILTGDFSPEHIHQRGIFTAWVKARFGDIETDFWGLGSSTGRVLPAERPPRAVVGPVACQLHIWNEGLVSGKPMLREQVEITVYSAAYENGWLFDIRTTQEPVPGVAMHLPQVYYGGTSFRGPSGWLSKTSRDVQRALARGVTFEGADWLPNDVQLDILTSGGNKRTTGDRKPARWIDFTGPLGDAWGGLAMYDHPSNRRYPTPLRIHPELPYFSYAFVQEQPFTVAAGTSLSQAYRVFVHDGHPDRERNEQIADSYQRPPKLIWRPL